jgi:hypothetical protein
MMKHHRPDVWSNGGLSVASNDTYRKVWLHLWYSKRDLSRLPSDLDRDGTPRSRVWDLPLTYEWAKNIKGEVEMTRGDAVEW